MKVQQIVEAALFSAGKAVSAQEIAMSEDLPVGQVEKACKALQKEYAKRDTVIEVSPAGKKWAMQVKREAREPAAKFAEMEIAPKVLKTLALIAYHQPMKQSDLVEMVGTRVYDHVPELKERNLVKWRREGATKILSVTPRFVEYFGLEAHTPDQIRRLLASMVGIELPKRRKQVNKGLDSFEAGETSDESPEGHEVETDAPRAEDGPEVQQDSPESGDSSHAEAHEVSAHEEIA